MAAMEQGFPGLEDIVTRLDRAVEAHTSEEITARIKADLEDILGHAALRLPDRFRQPRPDTYARRLLHRDPGGRYTAVVMTWGPGQCTPPHDHGGLWCVEGVVDGEIMVTQFDVEREVDGTFRLTAVAEPQRVGVGTAGRLIPPIDVHVLGNARSDTTSVTLHVYGGNLDRCRVFAPRADGRYEERFRQLHYHD
jgi:3-mercaptopropionate dioxygenase